MNAVQPIRERLDAAEAQNKKLEGQLASLKAKQQSTREGTPHMYNDTETLVQRYFPINTYTPEMDWFIQQKPVRTFLYYETMRVAYRTHPPFKPDAEFVMGKFMDALMSKRLQTHFSKATGTKKKNQDYGRVPLPAVVVDIANVELLNLGKQRIPGSKETAEFLKDRCNSARRIHVINSSTVLESKCIEEMAHKLFTERIDFVNKHEVTVSCIIHSTMNMSCFSFQWLFASNTKTWSFEKELKKTKALSIANKVPSDRTYDHKTKPLIDNIEELMFPTMDHSDVLNDMDTAIGLVRDLEQGISKPVFPIHVWDVSCSIYLIL